MKFAQILRCGGAAALAVWAIGSAGCIHNHYYGTPPPVVAQPGAVTYENGSVCETPAGTVLAQTPRTTVIGTPSVVINSQPWGVRPYQRGASRYAWRRSDADAVARTETEGGLDESVVK